MDFLSMARELRIFFFFKVRKKKKRICDRDHMWPTKPIILPFTKTLYRLPSMCMMPSCPQPVQLYMVVLKQVITLGSLKLSEY